jgi:hypothetical protein
MPQFAIVMGRSLDHRVERRRHSATTAPEVVRAATPVNGLSPRRIRGPRVPPSVMGIFDTGYQHRLTRKAEPIGADGKRQGGG